MIRRPGIASTLWFLAFVAVSILLYRQSHLEQPSDKTDIVFGSKVSTDTKLFVSITGALTGDGVAYTNNAITITCYEDQHECSVVSIEQIGLNQLGTLYPPILYPVTKWDASEIVAAGSGDAFNCSKVTITLERKQEAGLWVQEPINQGQFACKNVENKTYKWTIEDPPFWKSLHERTRPTEPRER